MKNTRKHCLALAFSCLSVTLFMNCFGGELVVPYIFSARVTDVNEDSISVSWTDPADYPDEIITFSVYFNDVAVVTDFSGISYDFPGLDADTQYSIKIRAVNDKGETSEADLFQYTLPGGYGQINSFTIVSGSLEREYSLYVPNQAVPGPMPLVFDFHGSGGNAGEEIMSAGNYGVYLAQREGFLYVKPQALPYHVAYEGNEEWNDKLNGKPWDDVLFTEDVMDECISSYNIDESRIYMMRVSAGGFMAWFAGVSLADRVAAIGPIAGFLYPEIFEACPLDRPFPVVIVHGTYDTLVPFYAAQDAVSRMRQSNKCTHSSTAELPDLDPYDNSTVTLLKYWGTHHDSMVYLYRVNGGYHGVPGIEPGYNNDINSYEVIWDFFKEYSLP